MTKARVLPCMLMALVACGTGARPGTVPGGPGPDDPGSETMADVVAPTGPEGFRYALMQQEPFTYHSTITNNILIGRDGPSQEAVINAAEIANAHNFISELPDGYDTIVGERGMKFSGGQQQRIAIARALLDRPDIMIFDEATSSLDTISERYVQESINHISKDRTVIIIAHRLSTIRHADKIIVLDQGRVVEIGNHEDLLVQNGHYARLAGAVG